MSDEQVSGMKAPFLICKACHKSTVFLTSLPDIPLCMHCGEKLVTNIADGIWYHDPTSTAASEQRVINARIVAHTCRWGEEPKCDACEADKSMAREELAANGVALKVLNPTKDGIIEAVLAERAACAALVLRFKNENNLNILPILLEEIAKAILARGAK